MYRVALLAFITFAFCSTASAQRHRALPLPIVPDALGVNIHFTDPESGEMEMLAAGGFRWVRMDLAWSSTERERGQYNFADYDRLMAALDKHKIKPLFILDYGNPIHSPGEFPFTDRMNTPEVREAFARWAAAAVTHFKGRGILWEIWNEPNHPGFWKPQPNVEDYIQLAQATAKAVRAAAPGEALIGPATSTVDLKFLEACFKGGLLQHWDAVSVHPYRQSNPETASEEYRQLRLLIRKYAPPGKTIPIISGEWGYSTAWNNLNDEKQGKFLARQWLVNLMNDVPLSIWYDWHDDGPEPNEAEHRFGMVGFEYHKNREPVYDPKPSYLAAKTLSNELKGFRFNKRLMLQSPNDYVLLFSREAGGKTEVKLVVWTTGEPHRVLVPASTGQFSGTIHAGGPIKPLTAGKDGLSVELTEAPQYLTPIRRNDLLLIAAAWERAPLEVLAKELTTPHISLPLRNVLSRSLDVTLRQNEGRDIVMLAAPEQRLNLALRLGTLRNEDAAPIRAVLKIKDLGELTQETLVIVPNPLRLTILPPVKGRLPLLVENPSGEAFSGAVNLAWSKNGVQPRSKNIKFAFATGQTEQTIVSAWTQEDASLGAPLASITDSAGRRVTGSTTRRFVTIDDFARYNDNTLLSTQYTLRPDGDAKVNSTQSVSVVDAPEGLPYTSTRALKIDYSLDKGWKFIQLMPQTDALQKVEGAPRELGLWVHGDGSGNMARLRFVDSTGQLFQPNGLAIDWKGWRFITFPMNGTNSGHWGGANNGKVRGPIKLDTLFLLDNPKQDRTTTGTVYITAPTLIY